VEEKEVRALLFEHLPAYQVETVALMGKGTDNVAYLVNDDLVLRFSRDPDSTEVQRESRLLEAVARISPLRVPEPVFVEGDLGCIAYRKVPGSPLLDQTSLPMPQIATIAGQLGYLLTVLHSAHLETFAEFTAADEVPLSDWRDEAAHTFASVRDQVHRRHHRAVAGFFAHALPDEPTSAVFSHNDLGIEHVMVDPEALVVTGVIDWTDAAIVDPAYDFGLIYRDLGPEALRAALEHYQTTLDLALVAERAMFYARCSVFEDLAYGIKTGNRRYATKSLHSMGWLF
jgi:aminoglycoside phosphotransferase (APT) family kinase protein